MGYVEFQDGCQELQRYWILYMNGLTSKVYFYTQISFCVNSEQSNPCGHRDIWLTLAWQYCLGHGANVLDAGKYTLNNKSSWHQVPNRFRSLCHGLCIIQVDVIVCVYHKNQFNIIFMLLYMDLDQDVISYKGKFNRLL